MSAVTIRGATLIDCVGGPAEPNVDVRLEGGRIVSIDPARSDAGAATDVDARGKFLIPGLWETEGHLTRYSTGRPEDLNLSWPGGGSVERVRDNLRSYLSSGVTTVVDLGGPVEVLSAVRDEQLAGHIRGARMLMVGRQFTAVGGQPIVAGSTIGAVTTQVDDPDLAARTVDRAVAEWGIDAIKANYTVGGGPYPVAPMLGRGVLDALVGAGRRHNLPVLVHIDDAGAALDAIDAGVDNIEHMFLPDPERGGDDVAEVAEACLRGDVYWPFTITLWESLVRAGQSSYLADLDLEGRVPDYVRHEVRRPESQWRSAGAPMVEHYRARFGAAMTNVAAVARSGVRMTTATDAGNPGVFHGPSARRELELMVEAGVTPLDALICATRHSAEKFRKSDLGTVEVGKIADLVLLQADPLADIRNLRMIDSVFQNGRRLSASDLDFRTAAS